jgi:DNA polymerase elongation subunit (family B)
LYQNIYIEDKWSSHPTAHVWDDEHGYFKEKFNNYKFLLDPNGKYTSMYGDPVKKMDDLSKKDVERAKKRFGTEEVTFESDIRPEVRYLTERYLDEDEPSEGHTILYFDIEVSMEDGVPNVKTAQNKITSVAYYDDSTENKCVLILDENENIGSDFKLNGTEVRSFETEEKLLESFVFAWKSIDPTIVVGYNSDKFDIPYTYRRLKRIFGEKFAKSLSPIGKVDHNERKDRFYIAGVSSLDYYSLYRNFTFTQLDSYSLDNVSNKELDEGKITYKGRTYIEQEDGSYTHKEDADPSKENVREVNDLDDLFECDIERFVEYNLEDVMLLVKMEEKNDYIELARKLCHLGHVPYEDVYMSSRYIDGAILTYLHRKGKIAPDKKDFNLDLKKDHSKGSKVLEFQDKIPKHIPERGTLGIQKTTATKKTFDYKDKRENKIFLEDRVDFKVFENMNVNLEFPGAYVKSPEPGRYEWVYDLDLTSMYPSIIMTINISPETKVGTVYDWNIEDAIREDNPDKIYEVHLFSRSKTVKMKKKNLLDKLQSNSLAIASNGTFYRTDKTGVIPDILEKWFTLRQDYKSTRNKWREKATALTDEEDNLKDESKREEYEEYEYNAEYYDKLQHAHKILINSVYGVLGLSTFRYYDVDNAQAVTDTGRTLIKFTSEMGNKYYNRLLGTGDAEGYRVSLDNGETVTIHPRETVRVKREGVKTKVYGCNIKEGDEIIEA